MKLILTLLLAFFALTADISDADVIKVTLNEAINIALKDNPALKSYKWTIEGQKEDVYSAKGNLYPKFAIEERYQRTNNPTYGFMSKLNQERFTQEDFRIESLNSPADISDFQTSIGFEQPLFIPGVYQGISMADNELEAQEALFRMKREEVILSLIKTFNMVQTAGEYVITTQKGIEDAREHKRLSLLKLDSGMGLHSDMLRAEVAVKRAEAMLVKAKGNLDVARRSLGLILGRTEPVNVLDDNPQLTLNDLQVYLDASLEREDLKALRLRYENSREAVDMEKSAFLPEIGLRGTYFMNDHRDPFSPEGESYLLMGHLKWNFFDASSYHKIKRAKAKVHETDENVRGLEKEINFRVNEAYTRVKEKEQNLSLSRAVLTEAEESLRLVRIRYENSLAPMVDLLDTMLVLNTVRAQMVEAENEYLNAIAVLYYESGMLSKTLIQN